MGNAIPSTWSKDNTKAVRLRESRNFRRLSANEDGPAFEGFLSPKYLADQAAIIIAFSLASEFLTTSPGCFDSEDADDFATLPSLQPENFSLAIS
jgi:hypothetical protein